MEKAKKCCICGKEFVGWGNNPWPVNNDDDAVCCDDCNLLYVIPARMQNLYSKKEKEKE